MDDSIIDLIEHADVATVTLIQAIAPVISDIFVPLDPGFVCVANSCHEGVMGISTRSFFEQSYDMVSEGILPSYGLTCDICEQTAMLPMTISVIVALTSRILIEASIIPEDRDRFQRLVAPLPYLYPSTPSGIT